MNLITLNDVIPIARRFVDSGASCDRNTWLDAIHEANQRLLVKADWPWTTMLVRARVDMDTFPLPREIEAIRAVNFDNQPSTVESPYFQFMSAGPGEAASWWYGNAENLEERGYFPTMYDVPSIERPSGCGVNDVEWASTGLRIMAFSDKPADSAKSVKIRGRSWTNTPQSSTETTFTPDEDVKIVPWNGAEGALQGTLAQKPMSANAYRDITSWTKPETAGHISLYAVEPSTSRMWFLAKAHPYDLAPTWRRYQIRNQACRGSNILFLGKIRAERPRSETDIMPIQNLAAIKLMLQAISLENAGDLRKAVEFEANAVRLLSEQKANNDLQGPTVQVIDHDVPLYGANVSRWISR
jgi:hypothetical protein